MGVPFCVKHFGWGASCEDTADSDVEILESVDFDVYGGVKGEVGEVPDVDMPGISLVPEDAPEDAHDDAPEDARKDAHEDVAIEKHSQCADAAVAVDDASLADAASLQPLQDATKTADVPSPKRRKVRKKRQSKGAQTDVVAETPVETPLSQQCKELPELLKERLQQIYFDERF